MENDERWVDTGEPAGLYFEICSRSVKHFIVDICHWTSVSSQLFLFLSSLEVETLSISEETVNPKDEKIGPNSFELLKVLGKGGYGKVRKVYLW